MDTRENNRKAHLIFSENQKTCQIVFSNGIVYSCVYETVVDLYLDINDLLKKEKITEEEFAILTEQSIEEGNLFPDDQSLINYEIEHRVLYRTTDISWIPILVKNICLN